MERMISKDKFKGVVEVKMRVMNFQFKICNVGETNGEKYNESLK